MIHPSYNELIETMNEANIDGENPEINSRYSIVMAAAKRARQIIAGEEPLVSKAPTNKPLTIAVEEIRRGKVVITEEGVDDFQFHLRSNDTTSSDLVYDEETDQNDSEEESGEEDEDEEEEEEEREEDRGPLMESSDDDDAE